MMTPVQNQRRKQAISSGKSERYGGVERAPASPVSPRKRTVYYRDVWRQHLIEDVLVALDMVERETYEGYSVHIARRRALPRLHQAIENAFEQVILAEREGGDQRAQLAPRLTQTLDCLDRGLSIGEIARAMGITVSTVRDYVKDLREFFHTGKKEEAVLKARMLGFLPARETFA